MTNSRIDRASLVALALVAASLSGCITLQKNSAMPAEVREQGLVLQRALPAKLPDQSAPVTDSQLVLIPAESAAGMVVPIPFVSELAANAYNQHQAAGLAPRYAALDVFSIVQRAMDGSPLLRHGDGKIGLLPVVYLAECTDDQYRISLAGRIEQAQWTGRYVTHLPTTYTIDELRAAAPATLATMKQELEAAAAQLRQLIERDAAGELKTAQYRADVGSLQLACAKVGGLVSAKLMLARDAEVMDDTPDGIIVRIGGDLGQSGPSGGLMYGLHYLRKDQLHTLKKK